MKVGRLALSPESSHLVTAKEEWYSNGFGPSREILIRASTVPTSRVDLKSHITLFRHELPLSQQAVWTGITRQTSMTSNKLG